MQPFEIEKAREETPGCKRVLHFNNAGASLMPKVVIEAVSDHFRLESEIGGYEAQAASVDKISQFYEGAARLIHAKPTEIAFIENATRAWDMLFYSLKFAPGDKILTAVSEFASNYIAFLQVSKRTGAKIEVVPNDPSGQFSLKELEARIDSKTKLIALTHVPNHNGVINPVEEVGALAQSKGIFYLLDATQSIGQMPVDVEKIGCTALCATGRKFLRGPRGTGFLYVKENILQELEPPFLDNHAAIWTAKDAYTLMPDARRFETWESNISNKIGLSAAIQYALEWGVEKTWPRIVDLATKLRAKLAFIPSIVLEDLGSRQCGIVTFISKKKDSQAICLQLREKGLNVSISLQEYARLDLEARHLPSVVRASVHYYNTEEEIERFCKELEKLILQS